MSAKEEAYKVLGKVIDDTRAKWLFESANNVMTMIGRDALDPIHVLIAATQDIYIAPKSQQRLFAARVSRGDALRVCHLAQEVEGFKGGGVVTTFNNDMVEMLQALGVAREEFLQVRERHPVAFDSEEWSWYDQLLRQSLESSSPAVVALRELTKRA